MNTAIRMSNSPTAMLDYSERRVEEVFAVIRVDGASPNPPRGCVNVDELADHVESK